MQFIAENFILYALSGIFSFVFILAPVVIGIITAFQKQNPAPLLVWIVVLPILLYFQRRKKKVSDRTLLVFLTISSLIYIASFSITPLF